MVYFIAGAVVVIGLGIGAYIVYRNNKKRFLAAYALYKNFDNLKSDVKKVLKKYDINI
jgi:hypothetical protein